MTHFVIIGLGSNLGNREEHLRSAITALSAHIRDIKESSVYASPAMLPQDAPAEWNLPFLNMAIAGTTGLSPEELLTHITQIEHSIGRSRRGHWGPREIDVDILAYDQLVLDNQQIRIPHPGLLERAFVLLPVRDVAAHWVYPRPSMQQGKTIHAISRDLMNHAHQCQLYSTKLS